MSENKLEIHFGVRRKEHEGTEKDRICTCRYEFGSCGSSSGYSLVKCRACVISQLEKGGHRLLSSEDKERFSIGTAHLYDYEIEPGRNECTCKDLKLFQIGELRSFKKCRNRAIRGRLSHGEIRLYCKKHSS